MNKTIEQYFIDWESNTFGYGYGSGEPFIMRALKLFLENVPDKGSYDYKVLEFNLTETIAWLLINALCRVDIIEYGSSPRFGWLTPKGRRLKGFIDAKHESELTELCCNHDDFYIHCYPGACNCGPNGYIKGGICNNPFWLNELPTQSGTNMLCKLPNSPADTEHKE